LNIQVIEYGIFRLELKNIQTIKNIKIFITAIRGAQTAPYLFGEEITRRQ